MVSGLVTSPWDQLRIFSGEARLIRIESKSARRLARSYGEERYMNCPCFIPDAKIYLLRAEREASITRPARLPFFNPRRAPDPASRAASSSARHRDTSSAARGSAH